MWPFKKKNTKAEQAEQVPTETLERILRDYAIVEAVPGTNEYPAFLIVTDKSHPQAEHSSSGLTFIEPNDDAYHYGTESYYSGARSNDYGMAVVGEAKQFRESNGSSNRKLPKKPELGELGTASPGFLGDVTKEYNIELRGSNGLDKYQKMRFGDGVVAGTLLLIKTSVNAGRWFIKPVGNKPIDVKRADFVWKCLTEYMSITWTQVKLEAMLCCEFGYAMFEKVWETRVINGKEQTVLKKLAPRSPLDVKEWKYDENGGPKSVILYQRDGANKYAVKEVEIPISKLIVFTYNKEFNSITGRSVLRPMYKHWYFKDQLYKIDAIQKERHGIGVPIVKLPVNFTDADKIAAETLGRNLRTNERAHITLPFGWEVTFAELKGQPVDALKSIELHDKAIRESILAGFIGSDQVTKEEDMSLFLKATRFLADSICDAFNLYLIPELIRYNYGSGVDAPKLTVRQIGEQADLRTLSFALRNVIGAGIVRPDDRLEEYVREIMDLPPADLTTVRVVKAPQAAQQPQGPLPNATPGGQNAQGNNNNNQAGTQGQMPDSANNQSSGKEQPQNNVPGMPRQTPLPNIGTGGKRVGDGK